MFCNFVQEKVMVSGWKVLSVSDREAVIKEKRGEIIVVSADASRGYSFVVDYLAMMSKNYGGHLRAADFLLQKMLGEQHKFLKASERIYKARLTLLSLSCAFGAAGDGEDCDGVGVLRFRYVPCPVRSVCPMNGFAIRGRGGVSCCNPVYESALTQKQLGLVDLLVNTSYEYKDIAEMLGLSEGRVKNAASEIYASIGVCDRQELTLFFRDKRIV